MLSYLYGWARGDLLNPAGMILYRQNMKFTVNKIKAQCAMTLMMENIVRDSSMARPPTKTAADNFGSCHIKTSSTATVNSVNNLLFISHDTVYS